MKNFAFTSQIDNNFFKVLVTFDGDFYKVTAKEKFNGKCYIITGYKVSAKQAESAKQAFLFAFNAVFSSIEKSNQTHETEKQKVSQKYSKDAEKKINTFVSGFMKKYGNVYKNAFDAIGACRADIKASVKDDLNNLFRPSQIFFYSDIVADRILDTIQANNK